jgi:hypothetical protein
MKTNYNPVYFGIIAAFVSAGLCFSVAIIRAYRDRKRRSAINAANGFDYQSTEKPFINYFCNN